MQALELRQSRAARKVKEDTAFPFEAGDPCLVEIDRNEEGLGISPIPVEEAVSLGEGRGHRVLAYAGFPRRLFPGLEALWSRQQGEDCLREP